MDWRENLCLSLHVDYWFLQNFPSLESFLRLYYPFQWYWISLLGLFFGFSSGIINFFHTFFSLTINICLHVRAPNLLKVLNIIPKKLNTKFLLNELKNDVESFQKLLIWVCSSKWDLTTLRARHKWINTIKLWNLLPRYCSQNWLYTK